MASKKVPFSPSALTLDPERETARICARIRGLLRNPLRRRGLVIGISGGVDSAVTAALAVEAVGKNRVFGLFTPERDSDPESKALAEAVATQFGIELTHEDIAPMLVAVGFHRRYEEAVRVVVPEYGEGWKSKLVASSVLSRQGFTVFSVVVRAPSGEQSEHRLPLPAYLGIVAATNFKQRSRKMIEYYHADRLHYAVAGTPNRLEYDQGFFVKNGDGAADVKPIAHLYKTQVYQLAEHLEVPAAICERPPTTDTYSLPQDQDEFFFTLPLKTMDLCLYARNEGIPVEEVAAVAGLEPEQVRLVFDDIDTRRATTRYLHLAPQLMTPIPQVSPADPAVMPADPPAPTPE